VTNEERAQRYAQLFTHYEASGHSVRANVPLDADVTRDGQTVHLGGVAIDRIAIDGTDLGRWIVRGQDDQHRPKFGETYETIDGMRVHVRRVSRDGAWADIVVSQPSGARWTKRQPLSNGVLGVACRLVAAKA
jgi:hypothetical protein